MSDSVVNERPRIAPELISPAGDWDCAKAAITAGADALYFGLQSGLNARARAKNFSAAELPELTAFLHENGARGYLTLNTLVFSDEFAEAEAMVRTALDANIDAVIVQDLGLAAWIHRACPELELHASTQMTLASAECLAQTVELGVRRAVLPRELSLDEINAIRRHSPVELEVFVHGALCVSFSGQCLASLALGGRSGNRGECAQACRMPYELIVDGKPLVNGPQYPLSPRDLAVYDRVYDLAEAGVAALKIEGRMKGPDYVATVVRHYRRALDETAANRRPKFSPEEVETLALTFSRGLGHGWLDGGNHQELVPGDSSSNRGVLLGEVTAVGPDSAKVRLCGTVRRGTGVVFEGDRSRDEEQGGRVYEIFLRGRSVEDATEDDVELRFQYGALNTEKIIVGQKVWKTDDPAAAKKLKRDLHDDRRRRRSALKLNVTAIAGEPLRIMGEAANGATCSITTEHILAAAVKRPADEELLRTQLGRLGETPYALDAVEATIKGAPMIPLSVLGECRREMIAQLTISKPPLRKLIINAGAPSEYLNRRLSEPQTGPTKAVEWFALCRSMEQITALAQQSVAGIIADLIDEKERGEAMRIIQASGKLAYLASERIQRPGATPRWKSIEQARPDGVLARNLAALDHFARGGLEVTADFSLNATNEYAVCYLRDRGAARISAAHDLDGERILALSRIVPPQWLDVVAFGRTPMMHSAHCLFCATLSKGTNRENCGRPCQKHRIRLRDRKGAEHPAFVDENCENDIYCNKPRSYAVELAKFAAAGIRRFRLEFLEESGAEAADLAKSFLKATANLPI